MITAAAWIVATAIEDEEHSPGGALIWLVILAGLMLFDLEMARILAGGP